MKNATKLSALLATLALTATLGACSSTPEPAATTPAAPAAVIVTPKLTAEQSTKLLTDLEKIHVSLNNDKSVDQARSTCREILEGKDDETVAGNAAKRFSSNDFEAGSTHGILIVGAVKDNGFCVAS